MKEKILHTFSCEKHRNTIFFLASSKRPAVFMSVSTSFSWRTSDIPCLTVDSFQFRGGRSLKNQATIQQASSFSPGCCGRKKKEKKGENLWEFFYAGRDFLHPDRMYDCVPQKEEEWGIGKRRRRWCDDRSISAAEANRKLMAFFSFPPSTSSSSFPF